MTRTIAMIDAEGTKYGYYIKRNKGTYLLGRCGSYEQAREKKQHLIFWAAGILGYDLL